MYINVFEAKSKLHELINEIADSHKPVTTMSKNASDKT